MTEKDQANSEKPGLFGNKVSNAFGGLFSKASVINNDKLVNEKKRTVIKLKSKEVPENENEESGNETKNEGWDLMDVDEKEIKKDNKKKSADEEDTNLEDKYMQRLVEHSESDDDEEEDKEEEEEGEKEEGEIEGNKNENQVENASEDETIDGKKEQATSAKRVDLKDKEFEKAERTIFIGNVPSLVMKDKRSTKDFKKFINKSLEAPEGTNLIDSIRFRSLHSKTNAPKKVAYISKAVDLEDVMNSYIVFKNKDDSLKAMSLNGKIYKDHHLRVDHLTHPTKKDNKLCVFLGNLAFEEKEESLWKFFNSKLAKEADLDNVISNVRIVRDSKTSFGKGFAIVQFIDTNFVERALLLDGSKLNKRSLRITRCKKMRKNNDAQRKTLQNLNERQKTIVGRAKILNKSDRNTVGKLVVEGERAKKGAKVNGIKKKRHAKKDKKRVTKRSQAFKKTLDEKK